MSGRPAGATIERAESNLHGVLVRTDVRTSPQRRTSRSFQAPRSNVPTPARSYEPTFVRVPNPRWSRSAGRHDRTCRVEPARCPQTATIPLGRTAIESAW